MHSINNEDLETFLIEAELINEKVKALAENRMSPEEFDKLQQARAEDKRKRQEAKIRKQKQAYERKRQGRDGKGITKDFQNFCKFCHRQYELPTPICVRCNRNTMTLKQRQQQLEVMVNDYKEKKKRREQRKMKWDMWQKTKAMLWKKTSNNYDKWDYFVSDSEQQPQKQPIVPKDDPNFKALQRDMQQRKALRMKQTQNAKKLKDKGNAAMKEGDYQKAMQMYTLALQHIKDIKSIYTNRALAFIKLGKFKKAIKDCTDVIEYMEIFEKVEENKDLVFKAYLRRALAKKQLKQYKDALEDASKALIMFPNDKSAEILKKEIEGFIEHSKNVEKILREDRKNPQLDNKSQKEQQATAEKQDEQKNQKAVTEEEAQHQQSQIIKQLAEAQLQKQAKAAAEQKQKKEQQANKESETKKKQTNTSDKKYNSPVQQIKDRLQNLNEENIAAIFNILRQKPELASIFIAAKGIHKCLDQLIKAQECKKQGFLVSVCLRGDGVGQKQVWDYGIIKIYQRISQILTNTKQLNMSKYFILEDIFEVLIPMSLHQKYRLLLADSHESYQFLQKTFSQLISKDKTQPDLFSSFLIYMGNLCSGNSKLRDNYIAEQTFKVVTQSLFSRVLIKKTMNKSQLNLKKNVYSLLANLIINEKHRFKLIELFKQKQQIDEKQVTRWGELARQLRYYPKVHQNFNQYILALLSLFANVTLGTSTNIEDLAESINDRFLSNPQSFSPDIISRALLVMSRTKYQKPTIFKKILKNFGEHLEDFKKIKSEKNPMEHIVRLLNVMYNPIQGQPKFSEPLPKNLLTQLKQYISTLDKGQILFCNTCNMFCVILDSTTDYSSQIYSQLKPNIKFLIDVAKDKVGNWRKNAAILLAKLSLNAKCKEELYKHHGMDVLKSIAQFVKEK